MDLREALKFHEGKFSYYHRRKTDDPNVNPRKEDHLEADKLIFEAAHRELERQEKERVEKPSIGECEDELRDCASGCEDDSPKHLRAADILKALREKVVPWLREIARSDRPPPIASSAVAEGAKQMLRALGEEP
jgi:hypothetical protein